MPDQTIDTVARVAPGSTAYVAPNDAVTWNHTNEHGYKRVRVSGAVDAGVQMIMRIGGVNENGPTLVPNEGFDFFHDIVAQDGACSIRFGANCNILRLLVTEEQR